MRRHRNPRYAPESLERKLSPSAYVGDLATVAAAYSTFGAQFTGTTEIDPSTGDPNPLPPPTKLPTKP